MLLKKELISLSRLDNLAPDLYEKVKSNVNRKLTHRTSPEYVDFPFLKADNMATTIPPPGGGCHANTFLPQTRINHHGIGQQSTTGYPRKKFQRPFISAFPKASAALVDEFAQRLYRNVSRDDLAGRDHSNIYGAIVGLWHSFNDYESNTKATIKVYNPEVSKHGWESPHTIIEIIQTDMPFMVDSVRMALSRLGINSQLLLHSPLVHRRNDEGKIVEILPAGQTDEAAQTDTVFLVEVDRQNDANELKELKAELVSVMNEVALAVSDWRPMRAKLKSIAETLDQRNFPGAPEKLEQAQRFLTWLAEDNFTLMGYRSYTVNAVEGDHELVQDKDSSLGLLKNSKDNKPLRLGNMSKLARATALANDEILLLTKTNARSRVHRPAHNDYIGIKRFDKKGKVIGEDRFIGLYAATFYNDSVMDIPLVSDRVKAVLDKSRYAKGTHASKALLNIMQTYPRDEIVQSNEEDLLKTALGVLQIQERDITRAFLRRDIFWSLYYRDGVCAERALQHLVTG